VGNDFFALKIFLRELSETIAPDLADEPSIHSASTGPHRNIGCTSTGSQHDLAKGVATAQKFRVGANEHVPSKVAENAQGRWGISRRT
jgi:hypothetical protein